ncbi:winged helix-turn-helix domain-containing protein [Amycolatopsis taiwanensis]|uniref:Transposase n=3 Tax=Amycolatopsis taiwanensis TaxID=342230 RepID=A0A9W6R320_9PSEU|nr:winged helix-turn-helix domain-containing protein [Amycolatopsis taiwanensis]GLY66595.1 transposase [Amycolatopsis taiwanensis]
MLYLVRVRYPDGGGLTAEGRARREVVRLQAAEMLAQEVAVPEIARRLRVSQNAVYVWRRRWLAEGEAGLASKGPSGTGCRLSDEQVDRLAVMLEDGPAAHGYTEDQRWTLARVADLITKHFRVRYTLRGVSLLLHRMGFSPQIPAHRPVERDEEAIATWRREAWQQAKR